MATRNLTTTISPSYTKAPPAMIGTNNTTTEDDHSRRLVSYYDNLQTIVWFDYVLGGARHFGYYPPGTKWPFPIKSSLLRMEEELFLALQVKPGAKVLDAGCGAGHVSAYMAAEKGLHVTAIDVVPRHVRLTEMTRDRLLAREQKAGEKKQEKNKKTARGSIEVQLMDYHHLEQLASPSTFDAVYTVEALVHASDPDLVLAGFLRLLRPGGRLVLHEYEQDVMSSADSSDSSSPGSDHEAMAIANEGIVMPTHASSSPGSLKRMLEKAGFVSVEVRDMSQNVRPMTRMNYAISLVPYALLRPLGLVKHSLNAVVGYQLHKNLRVGKWKYLQVTAVKPVGEDNLI